MQNASKHLALQKQKNNTAGNRFNDLFLREWVTRQKHNGDSGSDPHSSLKKNMLLLLKENTTFHTDERQFVIELGALYPAKEMDLLGKEAYTVLKRKTQNMET